MLDQIDQMVWTWRDLEREWDTALRVFHDLTPGQRLTAEGAALLSAEIKAARDSFFRAIRGALKQQWWKGFLWGAVTALVAVWLYRTILR